MEDTTRSALMSLFLISLAALAYASAPGEGTLQSPLSVTVPVFGVGKTCRAGYQDPEKWRA